MSAIPVQRTVERCQRPKIRLAADDRMGTPTAGPSAMYYYTRLSVSERALLSRERTEGSDIASGERAGAKAHEQRRVEAMREEIERREKREAANA